MNISIENATGLTETDQDSIKRSLSVITGTPYGACPYRRDMGLENVTPRTGSPVERNKYISDAMNQCETWEDRVTVETINFDFDKSETKMVVNYDQS